MLSAEIRKTTYLVEVSGWDYHIDFFVEKTWVEEEPTGRKSVVLRNRLREGSVVFIRPIPVTPPSGFAEYGPAKSLQAFPVAYRAERVSGPNARGLQSVNLEQLSVRNGRRENVRHEVA